MIGKILVRKPFRPDGIARDEDRDVIDESEVGFERAAGIKARRLLGPDRQIIDHDFGARFAQFRDDLLAGRFLFQRKKRAERVVVSPCASIAVQNATHHDNGAGRSDLLAKDLGAIGRSENRLAHVEAHLAAVDVESGHDFDVLRLVRPDLSVHQADTGAVAGSAAIEVDSLDKRTRTVADSNDGDSDFVHVKRQHCNMRSSGASPQTMNPEIVKSPLGKQSTLSQSGGPSETSRSAPRPAMESAAQTRFLALPTATKNSASAGPRDFCCKTRSAMEKKFMRSIFRLAPLACIALAAIALCALLPAIRSAMSLGWRRARIRKSQLPRKKIEAARGGSVEARSGYLPSVVSTGLSRRARTRGVVAAASEDYNASLAGRQKSLHGRRHAAIRSRSRASSRRSGRWNSKRVTDRVTMDVRLAFYDLLLNREKIHVREQSVGSCTRN